MVLDELDAFIRDLALLHERCRGDDAGLVEATRLRLALLVARPDVLSPSACEGSPDRYTQHVLHVSPDRSHSVVALVWYPGQRTPIHDHVSWCVVGVYEGTESQTLYHLADGDDGEPCLIERGRQVAGRGSCMSLIPPADHPPGRERGERPRDLDPCLRRGDRASWLEHQQDL